MSSSPADGAPWAGGYPDPAPVRAEASPARTAATAAAVAAGAAALGLPYALLWALAAPDIPLVKVDGVDLIPSIGPDLVPAEPSPEQFIAGDGWFALLGLAFGVVAALGAWSFARRARGPAVLVALAAGAVGSGMVAATLGQLIGQTGHRHVLAAAPGTRLTQPPHLLVVDLPVPIGLPLVAGLAAVVTYTLFAGWSRHGSLRGERAVEPEAPGFSSGSAAPPGPPAAPGPPAPGGATPPPD